MKFAKAAVVTVPAKQEKKPFLLNEHNFTRQSHAEEGPVLDNERNDCDGKRASQS